MNAYSPLHHFNGENPEKEGERERLRLCLSAGPSGGVDYIKTVASRDQLLQHF